jgi:hypothetical protein
VPPQQPLSSSVQGFDNTHTVSSAPVTPVMALKDESPAPTSSASASERQSALLSLLGGPTGSKKAAAQASNTSLPAQVPTPESSQRSNASPGHNENQGKILLEQLMSGYVQSVLVFVLLSHVFLPFASWWQRLECLKNHFSLANSICFFYV